MGHWPVESKSHEPCLDGLSFSEILVVVVHNGDLEYPLVECV